MNLPGHFSQIRLFAEVFAQKVYGLCHPFVIQMLLIHVRFLNKDGGLNGGRATRKLRNTGGGMVVILVIVVIVVINK